MHVLTERVGAQGVTLSDEELAELLKTFDTNGDNEIDFEEFCTMMAQKMASMEAEVFAVRRRSARGVARVSRRRAPSIALLCCISERLVGASSGFTVHVHLRVRVWVCLCM